MLTTAGQVVNVTKAPVVVVVLLEVLVLLDGKNVNVSPSVVMTSFVVKLVGTGIVLVPQIKKPEEEVTTTPSGRVSVNPGAFPVETGSPVGINMNISQNAVVVTGSLKLVGTVNVFVLHSKIPAEEVTTTPSGRVSVKPEAAPVEIGNPVG